MFNLSRFAKALMLSGVVGLVGCSQSNQNNDTATNSNATTTNKTVAVTAIIEHPALDAVRKGMIDQLAKDGFKEGENLKINFQSAQGNTATAGQIAKQFVADKPDVIVAIATPSAQSVIAATNSIPVVFSAVTDPVEAKLVSKLDGSGTNVAGVSDSLPLDPQIDLMKQIKPDLKKIGYVYSPGEVNSTATLKALEAKVKPMGIEVVPAPAQRTTDIPLATRSLQGKADIIYTPLDNNVASAYEALYQAAKEIQIPLVASDTDLVARGAVVALGVNYESLGHETGKIVTQVLKGGEVGKIPVYTAKTLDLHVSPKHAKELGVELPKTIIDNAQKVVE